MDYELYRDIICDVRQGENFYHASHVRLREMGGRLGSVFNWRLPTYAYLGALLPSDRAVQIAVLAFSGLALVLAGFAEVREQGPLRAVALVVLLAAVLRWNCEGLAFYAQEMWVAVLFTISLSATAKADQARERQGTARSIAIGWTVLAVGSGWLALLCRELALPYCVAAGVVAWSYRRRGEAAAWLAGCGVFLVLLAWHSSAVLAQLTDLERSSSAGAWEWIVVGGMGTLLMTARMNSFLYVAPNWLLVVYVFAALVGLADSPRRHCTLAAVAALLYLAAFCVVGLDINFYWGLMYAPLLPFGIIRFPQAIGQLIARARAASPRPAEAR
jgi:hypothetical protein